MQLHPVCEINTKDLERYKKYRNMFVWMQSTIHLDIFYSRDEFLTEYLKKRVLVKGKLQITYLDTTYRFGRNIAEILSRYIYTK
jgi:hypothetical protein